MMVVAMKEVVVVVMKEVIVVEKGVVRYHFV